MTALDPTGLRRRPGGAGEPVVWYGLISDDAASPLRDGLAAEYTTRYGPNDELHRFPATEFAPPTGAFLLLFADGRAVAGGAFRRYDEQTAEVKRMWTHPAHRRRGLARRVLAELEREAEVRGYRRIHLTTGPRQPEAERLYLAAGYQPRYDLAAARVLGTTLPFVKDLRPTDPPSDASRSSQEP